MYLPGKPMVIPLKLSKLTNSGQMQAAWREGIRLAVPWSLTLEKQWNLHANPKLRLDHWEEKRFSGHNFGDWLKKKPTERVERATCFFSPLPFAIDYVGIWRFWNQLEHLSPKVQSIPCTVNQYPPEDGITCLIQLNQHINILHMLKDKYTKYWFLNSWITKPATPTGPREPCSQ